MKENRHGGGREKKNSLQSKEVTDSLLTGWLTLILLFSLFARGRWPTMSILCFSKEALSGASLKDCPNATTSARHSVSQYFNEQYSIVVFAA